MSETGTRLLQIDPQTPATPAAGDSVYLVQGGVSRRTTAERIAALATKTTVGLGSVDNTSDLNKPLSTATQAALNGKATAGPIGASGLTMTAGILGQIGTGAPQAYGLGAGLSIVNDVLTVGASSSGTVTSVGLSVPDGFSVTPASITTSGTFAVTLAAGYSLPTTASQASWDAATVLAATAIQPGNAALADSREWSATTISQAEAEAGIATTRRAFSAQRVFQAVTAWWAGFASATGQALATAANAAAARATLGLGSLATQSGTFSGTSSGVNTGDQDLSTLLTKSGNLSDLTNAATARGNLSAAGSGAIGSSGLTQAAGILGAASAGAPQVYTPIGLAFNGANLATLADPVIGITLAPPSPTAPGSRVIGDWPYDFVLLSSTAVPVFFCDVASPAAGNAIELDISISLNGTYTTIYATRPTIAVGANTSRNVSGGTFSTAFISGTGGFTALTIPTGASVRIQCTQIPSGGGGAGLSARMSGRRAS